MRHLQIRDLWLQKEVAEGGLKVFKTLGADNPADLMTKVLGWGDINRRLGFMNLFVVEPKGEVKGEKDQDDQWNLYKLMIEGEWYMC